MRKALALTFMVLAAPVWGDAPTTSPRPAPRPQSEPQMVMATKSPIALVRQDSAPDSAPELLPLSVLAANKRLPAMDTPLVLAGIKLVPPQPPRKEALQGPSTNDSHSEETSAPVIALTPPADAVRPRARPGTVAPPVSEENATLRPRPRPASLSRPRNPASQVEVVQVSALAVVRSIRPVPRPENLRRRSVVQASSMVPIQPQPPVLGNRRGAVCGDRSIRGQTLSPIAGRIRGCGLAEPVRVTEVDGVLLSTPATLDCVTAQALRRWVTDTVKPNVGRLGGGVASLQVFAHYACRTRNNQPGARISEHGRGRAIDIGAINLKNGASITVLNGWRDAQQGEILRALHRGACGPFGTVLGPNSDRHHRNHFHFDTARYRSGTYCR